MRTFIATFVVQNNLSLNKVLGQKEALINIPNQCPPKSYKQGCAKCGIITRYSVPTQEAISEEGRLKKTTRLVLVYLVEELMEVGVDLQPRGS